MYATSLTSSDPSIAGPVSSYVTFSPYSGSTLFDRWPISAVIGRAAGTAVITHKGGAGTASVTVTVVPAGDSYVAASAGGTGVCVLDAAGRAYCTAGAATTAPVLVDGVPALASVDAGPTRACGLSAAKGVVCWPYPSTFPVLSSPVTVGLPADGAAVDASGIDHTCAITAAHDAYCWGSNVYGQLGAPGDFGFVSANGNPVAVAGGHKFQKISVGDDHTCGLGDDGSLWCWGSNVWGEVGVSGVAGACGGGFSLCQPSPARVRLAADSVFTDVAAGSDHTCALDVAGQAWCWGHNVTGALGTGDTLSGATPRAVTGNLTFVSLTAGSGYTCGLNASGDAYCWGRNSESQLGSNASSGNCGPFYATVACATTPAKVSGGLRFSALSAGTTMACGMASDGAWCWGSSWGSGAAPVRVPGQK
jgi:hypothetical protein